MAARVQGAAGASRVFPLEAQLRGHPGTRSTGHRRSSCVHPRPQREAANQRLWDTLYGLLNTGQRAVLDSLLPLPGLIPTIWAASL